MFIDSWRWKSAEQMQAALADAPNIPEIRAAMELTHGASSEDDEIIDER